MTARIAHVVRDHGGITEPFIAQRVAWTAGFDAELWAERVHGRPAVPVRHVRHAMAPHGALDRLFHRLPSVGAVATAAYRDTEATSRPDVIHAHYATTGCLVGRATVAPLVVSAYGFDVSVLLRRRLWRSALRSLAARAAAVLVLGPRMRDTLLGIGFRTDQVDVVPVAADLGSVPFVGPRATSGPGGVRLLMCGRFVEKKGFDVGIRAFARMRSELPERSSLDIVGSGALDREFRALVASLGVEPQVRFVGEVSRGRFHELLAASDLFLAPSRTARNGDAEGTPTTILDAQAVGTPVVSTRHADIPTLIADGATGYLAAEGDVASLVDAISRALADRASWTRIAETARAQVEARHADEVVGSLLTDVYRRVLGLRHDPLEAVA